MTELGKSEWMNENIAVERVVKALIQAKDRIYDRRHWEENEVRMENQDKQLELINDLLFIFSERS